MKLASIFTDHMVFQANKPIRIFGEGRGKGYVELGNNKYEIKLSGDNWYAELPKMSYGGPYDIEVSLNAQITVLSDVHIGEVIIVGGQSNAEMPLFRMENGFDDAKHAYNDKIRLFTVARRMQKDTVSCGWHFEKTVSYDTPWQVCCEENALHFSGLGYYIAKKIEEKLDVVVGIISCNWGGIGIESFIGREYFYDNDSLKNIINEYEDKASCMSKEEYEKAFKQDLQKWEAYYKSIDFDEVEKTKEIGIRATSGIEGIQPTLSYGRYMPSAPGTLYESMLKRIAPFSISAVVWYQGEKHSGWALC